LRVKDAEADRHRVFEMHYFSFVPACLQTSLCHVAPLYPWPTLGIAANRFITPLRRVINREGFPHSPKETIMRLCTGQHEI